MHRLLFPLLLLSLWPLRAMAEDPVPETDTPAAEAPPLDDRWVPGEVADLEELSEWQRSVAKISMGDTKGALIADGLTVEQGEISAAFDRGYLFPIYSGKTAEQWAEEDAKKEDETEEESDADTDVSEEDDAPPARGERRTVGYVFIGEGKLTLRFEQRAYARELANHMVMKMGADREAWAPIADEGAPLETAITAAIVLHGDPALHDTLASLPYVSVDAPEDTDAGNKKDVNVPQDPAAFNQAYADAKRYWKNRWTQSARGWTATDRMRVEQLGHAPDTVRRFADFLTDTAFGHVAIVKGGAPEYDRWLTSVVDPNGWYRAKVVSEVYTAGTPPRGGYRGRDLAITHQPPHNPRDPLSPPIPPVRMHGVLLDTTIQAQLTSDRFYLDTTTQHVMTVTAVGDDIQMFKLNVPGQSALPKTWKLEKLELEDGTRITFAEPGTDAFGKMRGDIFVMLPRPLKQGKSIKIVLHTKNVLPYANVMTTDMVGLQGSRGLSTGLMMTQPSLSPGFGGEWISTTRVGVPTTSNLSVAISGLTMKKWDEDGWRWEEAMTDGPGLYAGFAIGTWDEVSEPAVDGLPAIRVHLFKREADSIDSFAGEMRRVVATYQKFLPDFPWRELELFQAPDGVMGYVWIAPHGMVNLQSVRVFSSVSGGGSPFREGTPHMESGVLAHEIAHQYWGHTSRASHRSEGWVNETFSETFASLYTGLAYGDNDFESRMDGYRATWEEDVPKDMAHAPLLRAYEDRRLQPRIVYNYGPYVMHRMLRRRIGDAAFFGALDVYAREHYRQWADARQLLATFQSATEADLTDFFDFWIYGGRIPAVTLTWSLQDDDTVQGTITSDVPFGTFDVPVVVRGKKGKPQELMVVVTDGEGTFTTGTVPGGKVKKVELDPNGWILATDRKVKQVRN